MNSGGQLQRKIIHIDMDAFYAAVEQRDFPEYRGKPVIVGGSPDRRGVVATCSYEARKFGIHSAMPAARARQLCPSAIFIKPRFEVYRDASRQIQSIFADYTDRFEPLSLDEAYLDVTNNTEHDGMALPVARAIKQQIALQTGLTASAGISYNKFLAKIASDMCKPDGLYLIRPEQGADFVKRLPIRKFHGVGRVTEADMISHGIRTGEDLLAWSLERLMQTFGNMGWYYHQAARAIDDRPVTSRRSRKSVSSEKTFDQDLIAKEQVFHALLERAFEVADLLKTKGLSGRTVTIKVKYADFQQVTRSRTFDCPVQSYLQIAQPLSNLLAGTQAGRRSIRLLGVCVSNLFEEIDKGFQPPLL